MIERSGMMGQRVIAMTEKKGIGKGVFAPIIPKDVFSLSGICFFMLFQFFFAYAVGCPFNLRREKGIILER